MKTLDEIGRAMLEALRPFAPAGSRVAILVWTKDGPSICFTNHAGHELAGAMREGLKQLEPNRIRAHARALPRRRS